MMKLKLNKVITLYSISVIIKLIEIKIVAQEQYERKSTGSDNKRRLSIVVNNQRVRMTETLIRISLCGIFHCFEIILFCY